MLVSETTPLGLPRLGVNVDHVATLREARGADGPDPVAAALLAELAGADGITAHLRTDRRHLQDRDVRALASFVRLNLELALLPEAVEIALDVRPHAVCLVPEQRGELATDGGLDCTLDPERLVSAIDSLSEAGILVAVLIDPDVAQLQAAKAAGAPAVELHTGRYASARGEAERRALLDDLRMAAAAGREIGLRIRAGHGLDYRNVGPVARLDGIEELTIGHAIVSRAVLVGFERAVTEMLRAIELAVTGRPRGGV